MVAGGIKLVILPTAKRDLQEIVDFIARNSLKYAQLEKKLIVNSINKLYLNPYLGKPFEYKAIEARQLTFVIISSFIGSKQNFCWKSLPSTITPAPYLKILLFLKRIKLSLPL